MSTQQEPYILWLPSWYPNKLEPYNGDFIQRHARAAALYHPVTVIFFTQFGESVSQRYNVETTVNGNLKEIIVYIPFVPLKIRFLDRIRYNIKYYSFAKKILNDHFTKSGLPHIVHVHVPMKAGNLAFWIKRKFKTPFIVSEQASTYLREAPDNFFKRHWLYRLQVKKIFKTADYVTNVSAAVGEILKDLFNIKKFSVIHNTVDTSIFKPVDSGYNEVASFIHISLLNYQKNVADIVRSLSILKKENQNFRLMIFGPANNDLIKLVHDLNLEEEVRFHVEVPQDELAKFVQQADALILFSRYETFGCVIIEALACGKPVILSNLPVMHENAKEGFNAVFAENENPSDLAEKIKWFIENRTKFNAAEIANDAALRYNYSKVGKEFTNWYKQTIQTLS